MTESENFSLVPAEERSVDISRLDTLCLDDSVWVATAPKGIIFDQTDTFLS